MKETGRQTDGSQHGLTVYIGRALQLFMLTFMLTVIYVMPSVLWRCWLGRRKGIRPVKTERWGAGVVICLKRGAYGPLMPLPLTVSCFSKVQIGFTFLVPAHPGSPGQRAVKRVCVCVLLLYCDERVCLSVRSRISRTTHPNFTILSLRVAWLVAALRCVICFRFCRWRHVCS